MIPPDRFRWMVLATLPLLLLLLAGCAKKTHLVKGQVVFDDGTPAKELAGYYIMFESDDPKASATGVIAADGSFTVGTFQEGDGALVGRQRVAISPPPAEVHKPPLPPAPIAKKYGSFETSLIEVDIQAQTNELTIKVERLKK